MKNSGGELIIDCTEARWITENEERWEGNIKHVIIEKSEWIRDYMIIWYLKIFKIDITEKKEINVLWISRYKKCLLDHIYFKILFDIHVWLSCHIAFLWH